MDAKSAKSIFDFTATDINGNDVDLSKYKGTVCIVTNFSIKDSACEKVFSMLSSLYSKFQNSTRKGMALFSLRPNCSIPIITRYDFHPNRFKHSSISVLTVRFQGIDERYSRLFRAQMRPPGWRCIC